MTRDEYFARQRGLARSQARAERRQAILIRRAHWEFYAPIIEAVRKGESPRIDREALAERIKAIIRAESVKPAEEAAALQAEMEASLLGTAPIKSVRNRYEIGNAAPKITDGEWKRKRAAYRAGRLTEEEWSAFEREYYAGREAGTGRQSFRPVTRQGQGWALRASPRTGVTSYRRDPDTGKIIWDTTPIEWTFTKRWDLSAAVWKAVEEEEQNIFTIVRTGRALGRDVKDVAADLEAYVNYGDGGKRVMARWGRMFPNTEKGRREAWKRQYLADHPGPNGEPYQMFTEEARAALRSPEAKAYLKEKTAATTRLGTPLRPDAVKEYHGRLGAAGIDYRTMRIMRTETAAALADRQEAIARNSDICTGKVDWVLQKGRDGWNCKCAQYAAGGPYDVDRLPGPVPLHPNCFPAGTMILMAPADAEKPIYKPIEEIRIGDYVEGLDEVPQLVTGIARRPYTGRMIEFDLDNFPVGGFACTPDHPILTRQFISEGDDGDDDYEWNDVYIPAACVTEDTGIVLWPGNTCALFNKVEINYRFSGMVYNLTTLPHHHYLAGIVAVHNCNCQIRPHLKSDAEIKAELRRRTAADDEIIRQWREQENG